MDIHQEIVSEIHTALDTLNLPKTTVQIEIPTNATFGEFTSNIALRLYPTLPDSFWSSPRDLAEAIAQHLKTRSLPELSAVTVAGPGFLNFTLSHTALMHTVEKLATGTIFFKDVGKGKTTVVEYSSPNIAKPFTVGHLRSTLIGDAVANILETSGFHVKRDNHVGDWGTQFGKLIVAIKRWGDERVIELSDRPVKQLVELYVRFHTEAEQNAALDDEARVWFSRLEQGDAEAKRLWKRCVEWSWKEFDAIYETLDVSFTENNGRGYGESFFEDKMAAVVEELTASGYLKEGENGAKLFFFPDETLPPLMILKKDGGSLYATRDLATDKFRLSHYGQDILIVNEVGAEQELYFKQIFKIEELLGWYIPGQRVHVKHGHYRFKDGKMSTRKGNVIWLEDVIRQAVQRAQTLAKASQASNIELLAHQVGVGALKWNDLKRSSHLDVTFDWDDILSMQGNSGPYVQYTAVRARSVIEKGKSIAFTGLSETLNAQERAIARHLLYFPLIVERACLEYAPHYVATYLFELAQHFNAFYTTHPILDSEQVNTRLMLTQATATVLEKGLKLLGITVPEKM